mgnify:CR=1 FL=1|jgi:hypothetical protein
MLKWLIALFLVVLLLGVLQPRLAAWLRLGRLPGDLRFRLRGREYSFPFASVILLSLLASVLMRLL